MMVRGRERSNVEQKSLIRLMHTAAGFESSSGVKAMITCSCEVEVKGGQVERGTQLNPTPVRDNTTQLARQAFAKL